MTPSENMTALIEARLQQAEQALSAGALRFLC
jgi:hypothetical protein